MTIRTDPDRLAAVDALAADILALVAPLRVAVAHGQDELNAIFRLRFHVARERGWIGADHRSIGLETDGYDRDAVHVGAWDRHRLVGTQRIVLPAPGELLPIEHAFGLRIEPGGLVVEIGRTAIDRAHHGEGRHVLLAALMSRSWLDLRARGFHRCVGVIAPPVARLYGRIGLEVVSLGPAREHHGEIRFPARFSVDPASTRERLTGQDRPQPIHLHVPV